MRSGNKGAPFVRRHISSLSRSTAFGFTFITEARSAEAIHRAFQSYPFIDCGGRRASAPCVTTNLRSAARNAGDPVNHGRLGCRRPPAFAWKVFREAVDTQAG